MRTGSPRRGVTVALIQVRDHAEAARQEQDCVLRRTGLEPHRLAAFNMLERPRLAWADVAFADAVIIGGAGAHSVLGDDAFGQPLRELTRALIAEGRPLFGSCFGHQVLAQVLGGTVVRDEASAEVGTFEIELTAAGRTDPLLAGLPERFPVQLGHKDRIDRLPVECVTLARSTACAHQLVRVAGKPAYGSQFHAEMNADAMRARIRIYQQYASNPEELRRFHDGLRDTQEAEGLLARFLELYT